MDTSSLLPYLRDLQANNVREWFHETKAQRESCAAVFESLLQQLILEAGRLDPAVLLLQPGALQYKMQRDTRFSKDKSPYTPAFRAHIGAAGKKPIPAGYYIHLQPGCSFIGAGLCTDQLSGATALIRARIAAHPAEWERMLARLERPLLGHKLKRVPAGFDAEATQAEYLKHKSWYMEYPLTDSMVEDADVLLTEAARAFAAMHPLNAFINAATQGFA